MIRTCVVCQQPEVTVREIDGHIRLVDPDPVAGGPLVLVGELSDQPTALWGIEPGVRTKLPWGMVIEADALRYQLHSCTPSA